jgi:hypothetical protein
MELSFLHRTIVMVYVLDSDRAGRISPAGVPLCQAPTGNLPVPVGDSCLRKFIARPMVCLLSPLLRPARQHTLDRRVSPGDRDFLCLVGCPGRPEAERRTDCAPVPFFLSTKDRHPTARDTAIPLAETRRCLATD